MSMYLVTALVEVVDEPKLMEYAEERVRKCWQDSLESMRDRRETRVERALVEALLASNENPSPDEYGIEFHEMRCEWLDPEVIRA